MKPDYFHLFKQGLVIFGEGNNEEKSIHCFKAPDPVLAIGAMASHVRHSECTLACFQNRFTQPRCPRSRKQDIVLSGSIGRIHNPIERVEIMNITRTEVDITCPL